MKQIFLDGKIVEKLVLESLPMLIHGNDGSGASLYTISLVAHWYKQGYKILFLCGYPQAEQEFTQQIETYDNRARFFTKEYVQEFIQALHARDDETIIVIKNCELFDARVFDLLENQQNFILSGDMSKIIGKDIVEKQKVNTAIYFSPLEGRKIPELTKYHGYFESGAIKGITYAG